MGLIEIEQSCQGEVSLLEESDKIYDQLFESAEHVY